MGLQMRDVLNLQTAAFHYIGCKAWVGRVEARPRGVWVPVMSRATPWCLCGVPRPCGAIACLGIDVLDGSSTLGVGMLGVRQAFAHIHEAFAGRPCHGSLCSIIDSDR